ncbi:MAG: response regulator transcription factor [Acetatifactor sp.]|nr:response regulator transcription factor [Acetatifactor sp.]
MNNTQGNVLIYGAEGGSEFLECMLTGSGYGVKRFDDREKLLKEFGEETTAVVLYDFHTKSGNETDSLAFLTKLRERSDKPIIAIAGKEKEMLRILALNAGADDAMDNACSGMEGLARIQAQVRCYRRLKNAAKPVARKIQMDDLVVDDSAKLVTVRGQRVDLTPTEYKILHLLLESPGKVMSNKQIYESIWKMAPVGADNTIAVHVRHIREKIEENPQAPRYLQVVWGQGYKVG